MPKHELNLSTIDELDEISGDEQLVLVWCNTHSAIERHWVPISSLHAEEIIMVDD